MNIEIERTNDIAVVIIDSDRADSENAEDIKGRLAEIFQNELNVVIDLSRVNFFDSSGIGILISCHRILAGKGGGLKICGARNMVKTLFHLTRLEKLLGIYATREEALASFAG